MRRAGEADLERSRAVDAAARASLAQEQGTQRIDVVRAAVERHLGGPVGEIEFTAAMQRAKWAADEAVQAGAS